VQYLRLSVTDRCNLRCRYCQPIQGAVLIPRRDILSFEEMERLVGLFTRLGIRKVRLTGGEPLVRRGLPRFVRRLCRLPGLEEVALTTNGVFLAQQARELKAAGLGRVNISLDSLKPQRLARITGRDCFAQVWRGIQAAEEVGFRPLKLNMVVMKGINDDEIPDFVELARQRPYFIRFIEYMSVGHDNRWSYQRFLDTETTLRRVGGLCRLVPVPRRGLDGPARSFRIQGGRGGIGFISPVSDHFCNQCNRLRLTPEGHLRTCLFSDREVDLRAPLRAGCSDEELMEIMNAAVLQKRSLKGENNPSRGCQRPMYNIGG
jgi:cyclic pyranopterin phosphate synthase